MVHYQQQVQKVMRSLLPERRSALTASECELLAHLYLQPGQNTPVLLSQGTGSKTDERSYQLFITETGLAELKKGYEAILQPFYDLWRSCGADFEAFLQYADKLAAQIEKGQEITRDHEIL